jgi:hypothetical protein
MVALVQYVRAVRRVCNSLTRRWCGAQVCDAVRAGYSDAYQTAHFEVPGEMFQLAMEARERGMGTVGSTKNILDFISDRVTEALARDYATNLRFVLGTEAGMITSIVNTAQELLRNGKASGGNPGVSVEVRQQHSTTTVDPVGVEKVSELDVSGHGWPWQACSVRGCGSCMLRSVEVREPSVLNVQQADRLRESPSKAQGLAQRTYSTRIPTKPSPCALSFTC